MKNNAPNSSRHNMLKLITGAFLFCYFGFIIFPELSRPWSTQFVLWLFLLPIVVIALVVTEIRGGIGLWREKARKATPNPQNQYFVWLASLGILWFVVALILANATYFAYFHQKFDSEKWKSSDWEEGRLFTFSLRERMLDDLMDNTLPGRTKTEVIELLGPPNDSEGEELFYYTSWNIMEPKCLSIKFDKQGNIQEYDLTICG